MNDEPFNSLLYSRTFTPQLASLPVRTFHFFEVACVYQGRTFQLQRILFEPEFLGRDPDSPKRVSPLSDGAEVSPLSQRITDFRERAL